MRAPQRQSAAPVIPDLLARPQHYEFFQAVRLLLRWLGRQGIAPDQALSGLVRFRNSLALGFPPSDIEAIDCTTEDVPAVNVTPALMGLMGVMGTLPLHYTERIAAWEADTGDGGPRAFLDMFSSRQVALFYRAWCKYRVRLSIDPGDDRFMPLLLALAGVTSSGAGDPLEAAGLARFAAPLRSRVASAALIQGVLGAWLGVPVQVLQFAGRWDVLAHEQRTRLADNNCLLGCGATAGARLLRPELGVRIRVGPLGHADFARFLPGASGAQALARMLARFAIETPYRELQVVLRRDAVAGASLDGAARLGLDGFLCPGPGRSDRGDVCYLLEQATPPDSARHARAATSGSGLQSL